MKQGQGHGRRAARISVLTGVLAAAMTFAAGAASAATLTVWCWDPDFNVPAMQEAAARYAKINPDVKITVDNIAQEDIKQKLQTQLMAGVTDGLPDIVLIQDDNAQRFLQSFPSAFEPLSDAIDMKKFAAYKVAAATLKGKSYSVPFDSGVTGLFYRTDYMEKAGYKPSDLNDVTWDGLIKIAKDVKAKTGHDFIDLDFNEAGLVRAMMQSAGRWFFKPDGSLDILDNAPLKAALQTYADLWKAGIVKPVSGWSAYTAAFTAGDVVAVPSGAWMAGTIKGSPDQSGKWGIAPLPKLDGVKGATHYSNWGGSSWYVLTSSKDKKDAIDFLNKIWAGDIGFYQDILVKQGAVGSLLAARKGDAYKAKDPFFGNQPVWENFSEWLEKVPSVDYGTFTQEANAAIQAQLPALAKGGSVDDALKAINDRVEQQIQ
ncbi:sugar ABC transporter substrate-binding protein [Allorhizobium sp. BGMRC 0089]|uniref:ABC transporter substrate-binding protein n=1 Tax=Allorhizobium sonneratiae TaxID=2934936 RepID=UPI00203498A3|nr:sugar ABC transporter substrate-binding protein [Allorhizobium sonneratiae]MCM2294072.1 sugar ABC transporter substrate-binding protein [Allorhizobium sonneratiae]